MGWAVWSGDLHCTALRPLPAASCLAPCAACRPACCPAGLVLNAPPPFSLPPLPYHSPVGHYCSGGARTPCSAGSINPLLGQDSSAACTLCSADGANAGYTSAEGEAECTVPLVDIACLDNSEGREYDPASQTCVACPAGTFRPITDDPMSCMPW
jgi:hypothetical protein